jgi:hypothetical protein
MTGTTPTRRTVAQAPRSRSQGRRRHVRAGTPPARGDGRDRRGRSEARSSSRRPVHRGRCTAQRPPWPPRGMRIPLGMGPFRTVQQCCLCVHSAHLGQLVWELRALAARLKGRPGAIRPAWPGRCRQEGEGMAASHIRAAHGQSLSMPRLAMVVLATSLPRSVKSPLAG